MEISPLSNMSQLAVAALPVKPSQSDPKIAFGIGQEKLVELSPQGKILQQTEQAQRERAASGAADAQPESQARAARHKGII
jgi:hypothetical protein